MSQWHNKPESKGQTSIQLIGKHGDFFWVPHSWFVQHHDDIKQDNPFICNPRNFKSFVHNSHADELDSNNQA